MMLPAAPSAAGATMAILLKFLCTVNEHKFLDALPLGSPTATWWFSGDPANNPLAGTFSWDTRIKQEVLTAPIRDGIEMEVINMVIDDGGQKAALEVLARIREKDGSYQYTNEILMTFDFVNGKIERVKQFMDYYPVQKYLEWKNSTAGAAVDEKP